jgi:ABC-type multidrug transport system ATPase subunit
VWQRLRQIESQVEALTLVDRAVRNLSGGERQKLSILLALGHEPEPEIRNSMTARPRQRRQPQAYS